MLNHVDMPGIKSDRWIRRQSMLPTFMVTEQYIETNFTGELTLKVGKKEYATHASEDEIKACLVDVSKTTFTPVVGIIDYRPLTDEEKASFKPMIEPFEPGQVRSRKVEDVQSSTRGHVVYEEQKVVSWGTSSYGYDVRCADEFKIFTNINSCIVDPKNFDNNSFVDFKGDVCIIPPNSFALARTVEYFRIPRNVLTVCLGKSTYARCGIIVNVTPFEPEWEGYVTLEFSNTTPLPAKIYANEGCAQVLFFESDEQCDVSYKDRGGKYQGQAAKPVPPKV